MLPFFSSTDYYVLYGLSWFRLTFNPWPHPVLHVLGYVDYGDDVPWLAIVEW